MLILLDPLFVMFNEKNLRVVDYDFDPASAFFDLVAIQQKTAARQGIAVRHLIRLAINGYEKVRAQ